MKARAQYVAAMQSITDASTPEERIALRNALIAHPVLGRFYVSPMDRLPIGSAARRADVEDMARARRRERDDWSAA